jgi:ABC-type cobalamin/Fe3+-siderophores transport system ATPase subunit
MQQLSSSRGRATAAASHTPSQASRSVVVAALKRAKQYVARKELQNAAKHEYLKQVYEVR